MNRIKQQSSLLALALLAAFAPGLSAKAAVVDDVLASYQQQGASKPQAGNGEKLWTQKFTSDSEPQQRSCSSCHTGDLHASGKHAKTRKPIEPLAPSVNRERLTDAKKIEKWFKRNCKWTIGRECNAQEKADFLSYIRSQ